MRKYQDGGLDMGTMAGNGARRKLTIRQLADYPHESHTTVHSVCERHSSNQSYTESYQRSSGPHRSR